MNISPKDGTAATQLPTAPGAHHSTALNFSPMLLHSGVCGGKGSIRYGVCLPHFIPPMAPSLRLPGFGLQASGFPISITNLSAFLTILDSLNFHLEKMEVKIIKYNLKFNSLAYKHFYMTEIVKLTNFLDLAIWIVVDESSLRITEPRKCLTIFARISYLEWGSGF